MAKEIKRSRPPFNVRDLSVVRDDEGRLQELCLRLSSDMAENEQHFMHYRIDEECACHLEQALRKAAGSGDA